MADKSFGVKQINLIGASGTPTIESPNNLNLNATTVAISTDVTIGGQVQSDLKINQLYSVGIGTTNPQAKLDVRGDVNISGVVTATSFSGSGASLTGLTGASQNTYGNGTTVPQIVIDSNGRITSISNVAITGGSSASSGVNVDDNDSYVGFAGTINFGSGLSVSPLSATGVVTVTTSRDYWVLTAAGIHTLSNVGIGTTNPQSKLDVSPIGVDGISIGSTLLSMDITGNGSVSSLDGSRFVKGGVPSFVSIRNDTNTAGINFTPNTHQRQTVGSPAEYGTFSIFAKNPSNLYATDYISASSDGISGMNFGTGGEGGFQFFKTNENGAVDPTQIAKINPNGVLNCSGAIFSSGSSDTAVSIAQTGTGNALLVEDETNPDSSPFVISATGQVGIGTKNPQAKLDVNGSLNVSATLNVTGVSTFNNDINILGNLIFGVDRFPLVGILTAGSNATLDDYFGRSLATNIDGTIIAVGAQYDDYPSYSGAGSVYVFDRSGDTYSQVGILSAGDDIQALALFGSQIAMSRNGSIIVASAPWYDEVGLGTVGRAYVFERSGSTFTRIGILTASDAVGNMRFGDESVEISGDGNYIAIGNPRSLASGALNQVYVYKRSGGTFTEVGILTAGSRASSANYFGISLAFTPDASTLVVGNVRDLISPHGYVHIFNRSGDAFNEVGIITAPGTAVLYDGFGESVAITSDGLTIAVGADGEDIGGSNVGNVFIYDKTSENTYSQVGILSAGDNIKTNSYFGRDISMNDSGSLIVVGSYLSNASGISTSGAAHIFRRRENTFTEVGILTANNPSFNDFFSIPVKISPDSSSIIVGEYKGDEGGTDIGNVYVFDIDNQSEIFTTADGKLSIGEPNPQAKLDVNGDVKVGINTSQGLILTSPNGTQYRLIVDDSGNLSTVSV